MPPVMLIHWPRTTRIDSETVQDLGRLCARQILLALAFLSLPSIFSAVSITEPDSAQWRPSPSPPTACSLLQSFSLFHCSRPIPLQPLSRQPRVLSQYLLCSWCLSPCCEPSVLERGYRPLAIAPTRTQPGLQQSPEGSGLCDLP